MKFLRSEFLKAVKESRIDKVEELLKNRKSCIKIKTKENENCLHLVRSENIARLLLKDDLVEVNGLTSQNISPLFEACTSMNEPIIKLLLEDPRCDVNIPDTHGVSPLMNMVNKISQGTRKYHNIFFHFLVSGRFINLNQKVTKTNVYFFKLYYFYIYIISIQLFNKLGELV